MKIVGLALALVFALAPACGGDDLEPAAAPTGETATGETTGETTTVATTPPPPGPQPVIVVETPKRGDEVSSPFEVAGSANVFEANVTVLLLSDSGGELFRGFTTATCGSGCRGDFATQVDFRVQAEQPGTLVVSDDDADGDGKPQHQVRVPVVLLPR